MEEKLLDRYLKVKALSEDPGTSPGERTAARRTLTRMEETHDGIALAAVQHQEKKRSAESRPPPAPPRSTGQAVGPSGLPGNWENIFRYAFGFAETVREVVTEVTEVQYGTELAEDFVEIQGKSRRDAVHITIKLPHDVLMEVQDLNGLQKQAFRQAVQSMLEDYLRAITEPESD